MFFHPITIFAVLLLAITPLTYAANPDCRMMNRGEDPFIQDVEDLLVKLIAVCPMAPPRLPAMATTCYNVSYRSAEIRVCPPKNPERRFWSTPYVYDCKAIYSTVGNILGKCRTVISTGGIQSLDLAQYGYIVLTRPGGPNP